MENNFYQLAMTTWYAKQMSEYFSENEGCESELGMNV